MHWLVLVRHGLLPLSVELSIWVLVRHRERQARRDRLVTGNVSQTNLGIMSRFGGMVKRYYFITVVAQKELIEMV